MKRISALLGGAVLGVALLAACGGGGGGAGSSAPNGVVPPASTPTPPAGPSPQGFSATDAVSIPTPAPGATTVPVPLPSDPSGASANAAFPAAGSVPPDTTIAATFSATADSTVPALARARAAKARTTRDNNGGATAGAIAYLKLLFSADVTLPQAPAFSFVVPGTFTTANGMTYWLGLYDPLRQAAGWQKAFEGPATVTPAQTASGAPATKFDFASNGKPITFSANQTYYLVLLAVSPTTATPTPVPSTVPSNPPPEPKPSPVVASPTSMQFPSVTSSPQPVTFSEQGFAGPFKLYGNCTGIVNTSGASPTWTIIPVGTGRCYIAGIGDHGASAVVKIAVGVPLESPQPTHPPTTAPTTEPSRSPEPTHPPTTQPSESPEPSHSPEPTHPPTTAPSRSPEPTHPPATPTPTASPTLAPTTPPTETPTKPSPTPTPTPGSSTNR